MATWVRACDAANIENEDVIRFDYQDKLMPYFEAQKMNIFVLLDIIRMKMYISPKVW